MKLERLTDRVWYYPYEEYRDRPNLGYIRGDKWSLAVDAGHSDAHVQEFYAALVEAGLPLPDLTVLTHWHWDHTFGMHVIHGLSLANARTNRYLKDFAEQIRQNGTDFFLAYDERIRNEYAGGKPVIIVPADLEFTGEMMLDLGNCPVRIFQAEAPHTDDSTLIEVIDEKVLFIGDATGGTFPTWETDPVLNQKLADTLAASDAEIFMVGHWIPRGKEELLVDMFEEE